MAITPTRGDDPNNVSGDGQTTKDPGGTGQKLRNLRDEAYKWIKCIIAVCTLVGGVWTYGPPIFGVAAPYVLGAMPLLLFPFLSYLHIRAGRSHQAAAAFIPRVSASVLLLIPCLVLACFSLNDGKSVAIGVHLWTFVSCSAFILVITVSILTVWFADFYQAIWLRTLTAEAFAVQLMEGNPQDEIIHVFQIAAHRGRMAYLHDAPEEIPRILDPKQAAILAEADKQSGEARVTVEPPRPVDLPSS